MAEWSAWRALWGLAGVVGLGWYLRETLKAYLPSPARLAGLIRQRDLSLPGWAMTRNNLGTALGALGEREDGTERLEQAVAALRAALEIRTRERVPRQWAVTQRNLARAEALLAERRGERAAE